MVQPLVIWCVSDSKPGHRSQLLGLVEALQRRMSVDVTWINRRHAYRWRPAPSCRRPTLILAAGHHTHLPSLWLRSRFGGRLVVLMKPSLPRSLFDLCVVPEHDDVPPSGRVITTCGTLNDILPAQSVRKDTGLIMIGGAARRFDSNSAAVVSQIEQ